MLRECARGPDRRRRDGRVHARQDRRGRAPTRRRFLDRMYTNRMSTLAVGSIRYGLMCGVDGMAFDDGVVMRVGRRPLLRDHDDRRRREGAGSLRGVAPDGMAGPARVLHERHGAVGDDRHERTARPGRPRRARHRHRPVGRRVPVHDVPRRGGGRPADARRPRQLQRRARLRAERGRLARPRDVGGGDGGRRAVRHHAVRDRGDARAARREGLPDHRAGHRRHRHAARPGDVVDRARRTTRTSWAAGRSVGPTRRGRIASSSSGCCRSTRRR